MLGLARLPVPVVACVQGIATAAGCQLVASCDLAVAVDEATFATPGGRGGWFCHTPMVAIARDIGRKHAAELAYTGDVITADKALEWGLVNQVVPDADLDTAVADLLARATRGSRSSKALGKLTLHQQLAMSQDAAYQLAVQVMADSSQTAAAQEGMTAFLEKRSPRWPD
jgi:enoyl-CoA hydratase/carnithine racemase